MTKYSLPEVLETEVVRLIYAQVAEVNWTQLTDNDRTKIYQAWTEDPQIGGRLLPFMSTDQNIRVWIKNGPIKEHFRATYGVGKYAPCVTRPAIPVHALVTKALGPGWIVDPDSLTIKPLTVTIRRDGIENADERFTWGSAKDFKHLVWATIKDQANGDSLPRVLCLIETFTRPVSTIDKSFHKRVGERLAIAIKHVTDG